MPSGGETPLIGSSNNSPGLNGELELYFEQSEMPVCKVDEEPSLDDLQICYNTPTGQPSLASLFTPDNTANDAYKVGSSLIEMANGTDEYETAMMLLGQAGQIFTQFGHTEEAKNCSNLMIGLANANGHTDDAAFYTALQAMGEGNIAEIEKQLESIPADYTGREILDNYVTAYHQTESMAYTFAAAQAHMQADINSMEETETSFLAFLFSWIDETDFTEAKRAYAHAEDAWRKRLQSGQFSSTRAILEDIWRTDPKARVGIAMLAGYYDAWHGSEYIPTKLSDALTNEYSNHVTLGALVEQEENPNPAEFREYLSRICANADEEGKTQVSAVAAVYRENADFSVLMNDLIEVEFTNRGIFVTTRDVLRGFTDPVNMIIMVGGFGLARITTAAIMSRIAPAGIEGLTLAARLGVTATEVTIEAGAFTLYQRLLTQLLTTHNVDWSPNSFARDWASLAMCFGFLRAANMPLNSLRQTMGRSATFGVEGAQPIMIAGRAVMPLSPLGRTIFGITENVTQTAAFYGGGLVSYQINLRDAPPHFFEEWLTLLQFQMGVRASNVVTHGWVDAKAYQIRTRPLLEAAQAIAEGMVGEKSAVADIVAQHIFLAHVRGDVSGDSMVKLVERISEGQADSVSDVLQINAILENANLPLLWDGTRIHEVPASVRDAYISELIAYAANDRSPLLEHLALATVSSTGPVTAESTASTVDATDFIYYSVSEGTENAGESRDSSPADSSHGVELIGFDQSFGPQERFAIASFLDPAADLLRDRAQRAGADWAIMDSARTFIDSAQLIAEIWGVPAETPLDFGLCVERGILDANGKLAATVRFWRPATQSSPISESDAESLLPTWDLPLYPNILDAMTSGRISRQDILKALTEKGYANLDMIEQVLEKTGSLEVAIAQAAADPTSPMIEITRMSDGQKIIIQSGFEAVTKHQGIGGLHILAQRSAELMKYFRRPNESPQSTYMRFMENIIKIASTSTIEIPSHVPGFSFLLGKINGQGQYLSVLVDKTNPRQWRIVTTVYQPTPEKMRRRIAAYYISELMNSSNGSRPSDAQILSIINNVNGFLISEGLEPLTIETINGIHAKNNGGQKQIADALKARGFRGKSLKRIETEVNERFDTLSDALNFISTLSL